MLYLQLLTIIIYFKIILYFNFLQRSKKFCFYSFKQFNVEIISLKDVRTVLEIFLIRIKSKANVQVRFILLIRIEGEHLGKNGLIGE
jgi:hypothetical protein